MNPTEFAQKIRAKYPGSYDNIPDEELARKVVQKYPTYASSVNFSVDLTKPQQPTQTKTASGVSQFDPAKASTIANVVGGEALARGAGLGLAAPSVQKGLSESELQLSDTAIQLQKRINQNKKEGKDTSRLENALKELEQEMGTLRGTQEKFVEGLPTTKEVIGSAAQLATTAAAGSIARGATALTGAGKATGIVSGVLRGTAAGGITGGATGALYGASEGLQENKDLYGVASSALIGGVVGTAIGAPIGGITGAISGGLKASQVKKENFLKEFVRPEMDAKERAKAIYQGRLKDPGLFRKAEIGYSSRDEKLANAVKDVVSPKGSLGENIDAIKLRIDQTDDGVRNYISTHKVPFNGNQLRSQLETAKNELDLVFASDATAENTYNKVVDAFIRNVGSKDTLGLFEGRQTFDQLPAVKKLLDSAALGENTRKEIVLAVRKAANEYIASLLPDGSIYKNAMSNQHLMLESLGNLSDKYKNIIGKNNIQLLAQKYPLLKYFVGTAIGGALAGGLVGGAIIGSTD